MLSFGLIGTVRFVQVYLAEKEEGEEKRQARLRVICSDKLPLLIRPLTWPLDRAVRAQAVEGRQNRQQVAVHQRARGAHRIRLSLWAQHSVCATFHAPMSSRLWISIVLQMQALKAVQGVPCICQLVDIDNDNNEWMAFEASSLSPRGPPGSAAFGRDTDGRRAPLFCSADQTRRFGTAIAASRRESGQPPEAGDGRALLLADHLRGALLTRD